MVSHFRSQHGSVPGGRLTRAAGAEESLTKVMTPLFFVGVAAVLSMPLLAKESWLIFVQDDLLYYIKVAQSIASGHGSTFNGIAPTNGYQPLWLMILVALSWVTAKPRAILAFLAISNLLAAGVTFVLSRRLLRSTGAGPVLLFGFSAGVTLYSLTLFFYGMEVTLTVPLMLAALCMLADIEWLTAGWVHSFLFGLVLAAMVLSRIDTMIFGALLLCGILVHASLRRLVRADLIAGVALGLLPVAIYFLINHAVFHTWLPVSGMAKELKNNHLPSIEPWRVFFHPLAGMFTLLILTAMVRFYRSRIEFDAMHRVIFWATLVFPFLYFFVLSCVSDWTLWGWYMYPIRLALCVSFVILLSWGKLLQRLENPLAKTLLVASVFGCLSLMRWTRQQTDIYAATLQIQQFAQSHPGVYAMGDRAGRVGYLISDPVIQTEGLMMDREYLGYVERETPLRDALSHYNVRYYIATAYQPFSGCFEAAEPAKAGPASAKMRATFCDAPEATFFHDGIETMIFDLAKH